MLIDHLQELVVAADTIVLVVAPQLGAKRLVLLAQILMAIVAAPLPHGFHEASQTFPYGSSLNDPVTLV